MISIGITLIIWGIILFCVGLFFCVGSWKYLQTTKKIKKDMEKAAQTADVRLRKEYNKIATLPPKELHNYLVTIFVRCLELAIDREISDRDPDAKVSLMAIAEQDLILYIGLETNAAIDYYYGENYIDRWVNNSYRVLEKRGVIQSMINNKGTRTEFVEKELMEK